MIILLNKDDPCEALRPDSVKTSQCEQMADFKLFWNGTAYLLDRCNLLT